MGLPVISAGDLRHVLTLQTRVKRQSATGDLQTGDWSDDGQVFASVRGLNVFERAEAAKQVGSVSHLVTLRSYGLDLTGEKRFLFGSRILKVVGANDWDESMVYTRVWCLEQA